MAIRVAVELWHSTRKLKVAPDDVTKASLIDHLDLAKQVHVYSPTEMLEYHTLMVGADELGVLLPAHDLSFMSTMNALFDNRDVFKESRRGREDDLNIVNPQAVLLAGTQPDFLAGLLPPEAWGMGFMSRMLMVYSGSPVKVRLFGKRSRVDTRELAYDLSTISELHGDMIWTSEAEDRISNWHDAGCPPVPEHSKLKHYVPRRILSVLKLSMISAVSRHNELLVEAEDVTRAIDWLIEIEGLMPEIFKDMSGKSDILVIQDLHHYVYEMWGKTQQKGFIHRSRIENFLSARTPSYNIQHIMKACTGAGILLDHGNDLFTPGPLNSTGED